MAVLSLADTWTGMLVYGSDYQIHEGEELYFRMKLTQEDKWFSGTAMDIGGFGTSPDPASISGLVVGSRVYFIKQYISFHYLPEAGKDQGEVDRSKAGPEIYYTGTYDAATDTISGDWGFQLQLGAGMPTVPNNLGGNGSWVMKRK